MGQQQQQHSLGDTKFTKVFVGGLAWETQKDALRDHFEQFGGILEAVIISDKLTGRSKGYGFVTFKEAESAKKACEEAAPFISGRRANCNLASLGARRMRSPPPPPIPQLPLPQRQPGMGGVTGLGGLARGPSPGPPATWYYHPSGTPPPPPPPLSPYHNHHHHYPGVLPYYLTGPDATYGYTPSYMADLAYSTPAKLNYPHRHPQGQFPYPVAAPNGMLPVYPMYHFNPYHQQPHTTGIPAHYFAPATATAAAIPAIISKPPVISPTTVCLAVEQVASCN